MTKQAHLVHATNQVIAWLNQPEPVLVPAPLTSAQIKQLVKLMRTPYWQR